MPVLTASRNTTGSDGGEVEPVSEAGASSTTETTDDGDGASDAGSDASSISLISVPPSDDDDEVDWEETRARLTVVSPDRYVVLYDESSEEE